MNPTYVHGLRGNLYPQLVERSEESKSFQLIFNKMPDIIALYAHQESQKQFV